MVRVVKLSQLQTEARNRQGDGFRSEPVNEQRHGGDDGPSGQQGARGLPRPGWGVYRDEARVHPEPASDQARADQEEHDDRQVCGHGFDHWWLQFLVKVMLPGTRFECQAPDAPERPQTELQHSKRGRLVYEPPGWTSR